MKHNKKKQPMTGPLLKDLIDTQKAARKVAFEKPSVGSTPLAAPDEYQNAGGSYNLGFIFPQE